MRGDPFIIAKAGKPLVKVIALDAPDHGNEKRLGFISAPMMVPEDFDQMGRDEIEQLFGVNS